MSWTWGNFHGLPGGPRICWWRDVDSDRLLFFICSTQLSPRTSSFPIFMENFSLFLSSERFARHQNTSPRPAINWGTRTISYEKPISLRLIYRGSETISKLSIVTCSSHLSWSNTLTERIQYFYQTVNWRFFSALVKEELSHRPVLLLSSTQVSSYIHSWITTGKKRKKCKKDD